MPILDMPFHFVKWSNPAEVVVVDLKTNTSKRIFTPNENDKIPDLPFLRGSSQVIPWGDYHICLVHDCDLFHNRMKQKDATYMHRFVIWDRNWKTIKITDPFSFMDGEIEFCCGMAILNEDMLITFGFQDNAAYILKIPGEMIPSLLFNNEFEWGIIEKNDWFRKGLEKEVVDDIYQKFFKVEENDVVFDIGASVGVFTNKILHNNPSKVICIEPQVDLYKSLVRNVGGNKVVTCYNSGIADKSGPTESNTLYDPTVVFNTEKNVPFIGISFKDLITNIDHIDFLKIDCEGGEYDVFNDENLPWIKNNVYKIAGEVHLRTPEEKVKFRHFRDTYLKAFPNFKLFSYDMVDITWDIWNEHFLEYYINCNFYIDNRVKWRSTKYPSLEITTYIPENGCAINCLFCPQGVLKKAYNVNPKELTLEAFKFLIDKIPKEVNITFAGFAEPFLNPDCTNMILYAHNSEHKVSVFTTGVGMVEEDIDRFKSIPFDGPQGGFVLHLPDKEGYAGHKGTASYIDLAKKLSNGLIHNFNTVTMGTLPDDLRQWFPNTKRQEMWSRAGNLDKVKIGVEYNKITHASDRVTCNCIEKLYHNVLLPNGDIVLCCMDYGLENKLGNLFKQEYEDIVPDKDTVFKLCSNCENGVKV
jgi:FkbM family methyltransferase